MKNTPSQIQPYRQQYLWQSAAILIAVLAFHFLFFALSFSNKDAAQLVVGLGSIIMSEITPGSKSYELTGRIEVAYLQLALVFTITTPATFFLMKSVAEYGINRNSQYGEGHFEMKVAAMAGIGMCLLFILIPPAPHYTSSAKASYFGALAPIRYGFGAFALGYLLRLIVVLHMPQKDSNVK
jgi:hypothetical protein